MSEKVYWRDVYDAAEKRISELENHDIFKVWKSVRKGGKATLDAMLNLNQGLNELKENCEVSFAKVEDHIMRILKVVDMKNQTTEMLIEQFKKYYDAGFKAGIYFQKMKGEKE